MKNVKPFDVFVSHASDDRPWVLDFLEALEAAWDPSGKDRLNLRTSAQVRAEERNPRGLKPHVDACRIFLPVLSSEYVREYGEGGPARIEFDLAEERESLEPTLIHPVLKEVRSYSGALARRQGVNLLAKGSRAMKEDAKRLLETLRPKIHDRREPLRVVAIANLKGGVGKTTLAIALAEALASTIRGAKGRIDQVGRRVLLIDGDLQGNLTEMLLGEHDGYEDSSDFQGRTAYDLVRTSILQEDEVLLQHYLQKDLPGAVKSARANLLLIPGSKRMGQLDRLLGAEIHGEAERLEKGKRRLRGALQKFASAQGVRVVLIDTPPGLTRGTSALVHLATDYVVPVRPDRMSLASTKDFLAMVSSKSFGYSGARVAALVVNQYNSHRHHQQKPILQEVETLAKAYGARFFRLDDNVDLSKVAQDVNAERTFSAKYPATGTTGPRATLLELAKVVR